MSFMKPKMPKMPDAPAPPPTVSDATAREEFSRKYGKRKGSMANMYAKGAPAPSSAVRTALGVAGGG